MEEKGNELIIIAICDGNCPLADATKSYTVDKKIMTPNGLQAQNANHLSLHFFFSKNALDGSRLFQALPPKPSNTQTMPQLGDLSKNIKLWSRF